MKIGAKTSLSRDRWSIVKKLAQTMDFIEVYFTEERIELSKLLSLKTRWVIHGPHQSHDVNLSDGSNIKFFKESIVFTHDVGAKYVITHPGHYEIGNRETAFENTVNNINLLKKFSKKYKIKLLIENMIPSISMGLEVNPNFVRMEYIGYTPSEMKEILKRTKCKFILDFAHAYLSSLHIGGNYKEIIKEFMKFKPVMFHLSDGFLNEKADKHIPLGKGNYDLPFFISLIKNHDVTLEINPVTVKNFIDSKNYIKKVLSLKT